MLFPYGSSTVSEALSKAKNGKSAIFNRLKTHRIADPTRVGPSAVKGAFSL
jgi:hypothetical protein